MNVCTQKIEVIRILVLLYKYMYRDNGSNQNTGPIISIDVEREWKQSEYGSYYMNVCTQKIEVIRIWVLLYKYM